MEVKLKRLLDFQRFVRNRELAAILDETESKYRIPRNGAELSDDDLDLNAAGEFLANPEKDPRKDR